MPERAQKTWVRNLMASAVLFLIAIPLNLGIALASKVGAAAGLLTGLIGALVVAPLAGCPLMITGPATGLIAVVWQIIDAHGIELLPVVVVGAGLLQLGLGFLRLGAWFRAVSPAVIQGMLAGIGVLIFASQLQVMFGSRPTGAGWSDLLALFPALKQALFGSDPGARQTAAVGFSTMVITLLWPRLGRRAEIIPGALPGVAVGVLLAGVLNLKVNFVSLPSNWELSLLSVDRLGLLLGGSLWGSALALMFVATAQTLLTATAVDRLHKGPRTSYNREVAAQGAGNLCSGLLGGLPLAGVIVRSAAAVQAGSRGRASSFLHGLWLLLFLLFFAPTLERIPIASLAAVLVVTGLRLVNLDVARGLAQFGRAEPWIYLATLLTIVAFDLLTGILVGIGCAAARLVYVLTHCQYQIREDQARSLLVVELSGSATFFTLPSLTGMLESIRPGQDVHLFVRQLDYIDHACLESILQWEEQYLAEGGQVSIEWDHLVRRFKRAGSAPQNSLIRDERYEEVVTRATTLELAEDEVWGQMVERIVAAVPVADQASLQGRLSFKIQEGGGSFTMGAAVMGLRLAEQLPPHLVVVHSRRGLLLPDPVTSGEQRVFGFLLLIGSQERPDAHLALLAALISRVAEGPVTDWTHCAGVEELRDNLLRHERFLTLHLETGSAAESFVGKRIWQLGDVLPQGVLIALIERDGEASVPKGNTQLKRGDTLTILGQPEEIEKLYRAYSGERGDPVLL